MEDRGRDPRGPDARDARVKENEDVAPREYRWVHAEDKAAKTTTWFLYAEATDGPWPAPGDAAAGTAPAAGALDPETSMALGKRMALANVRHDFEGARRDADAIVVRLRLASTKSLGDVERGIAPDVVPAARTAFAVCEWAKAVRRVVLARYRDRLGVVGLHPFATRAIERATWDRIVFENLTNDDVVSLFARETHEHASEGLILRWKD